MAEQIQKQKMSEREVKKSKIALRTYLIPVIIVMVLLFVLLFVLWLLDQAHPFSSPWHDIFHSISFGLITVFGGFCSFIATVLLVLAAQKEVLQKLFPSPAPEQPTKEQASTPGMRSLSNENNQQTSIVSAAQTIQSPGSKGTKKTSPIKLEIKAHISITVTQTSTDSVFSFNDHLPNPNEFYGRKRERTGLINRTRKGASTSIVGPRRIGKTWIIEYLLQVASQELGSNYRIAYVDATSPRCKTVSGFTSIVLERLGIHVLPPDAELNLEVLEEAIIMLKSNHLTPILCLDEFEGFDNRQEFDLSFFTGLRAICLSGLGLIAASKTTLFEIVGNDGYTSGFFNIFDTFTLKPFDENEAKSFIQAKGIEAKLTEIERGCILKYGQQQAQRQWFPLRLQLAGEMLLEDKKAGYYCPDDVEYWLDYRDRLETKYRAVVR